MDSDEPKKDFHQEREMHAQGSAQTEWVGCWARSRDWGIEKKETEPMSLVQWCRAEHEKGPVRMVILGGVG